MSNITLDEMKPLFSREMANRRGLLVLIFVIAALAFLAIAYVWEKRYVSFAQIQVDDQKPLTSVLDTGTRGASDQAIDAKKELFKSDIMDQILDEAGFADASTSLVERTLLISEIQSNTEVSNLDSGLIKILYEHHDPKVAFKTTSLYADLFVNNSAQDSVLYSLAEPASFPKNPQGLRFIHITIGGLLLSFLIPFIYLAVFLKADSRIRTQSAITEVLELPLLATVPRLDRRRQRRSWLGSTAGVVIALAFVFVVYVVVAFIKFGTAINVIGGVL